MAALFIFENERLMRHTIFEICGIVENYVSPHTNRGHAIPTHIQVIVLSDASVISQTNWAQII